MQRSIIVASSDTTQHDEVMRAAMAHACDVVSCRSLMDLERQVHRGSAAIVILDMDALPVDNRFFRNLTKACPEIRILALSNKTFHPELKESISSYIHACLAKPIDPDELGFWLRSIQRDGTSPQCRQSPTSL